MSCARIVYLLFFSLAFHLSTQAATTLNFGGYEWEVKTGHFGPGPNHWAEKNVWLDKDGALHLKITNEGGKWYCAELGTKERLGFGRYHFQVIGRLDKLDSNIVFGIFPYPTPDVGPDGTMEIDIEFARWGRPDADMLNYTVWPPQKKVKHGSKTFPLMLNGDYTTHQFIWSAKQVAFMFQHGHQTEAKNPAAEWVYQPEQPELHIAQKPMPLRLNLWLFKGKPPTDDKPVELVIKSFKFVPEATPKL